MTYANCGEPSSELNQMGMQHGQVPIRMPSLTLGRVGGEAQRFLGRPDTCGCRVEKMSFERCNDSRKLSFTKLKHVKVYPPVLFESVSFTSLKFLLFLFATARDSKLTLRVHPRMEQNHA